LTPSAAKESSTPLSGFSFKAAAAEAAQRADDGDDADHHDESADHDHDPHFEPIIPLPELVQVKTGEEEEQTLFEHKAKMYR
jgi:E3 SUMO-protein ligase RanBP2